MKPKQPSQTQQELTSAATSLTSDRCGASRAVGGQKVAEPRRSDALASNTASDNSNIPFFKPLRWGVDSLYLSYPGTLSDKTLDRLKHLKALAQSSEPVQQARAQFLLGGHIFEVKDKGAPLFPYVLDDGAFRIQLAKPSKTVPMAYVKVSSTYLAHVGPAEAEKALYALLSELGEIREAANVSRIDLFVDFVSHQDMEWNRQAWVTRAASVNAYAVNEKFSGWTVGQGSDISARLYNKLLEIVKSGKDYLLDLWGQVGWQPGEPVWRLEFQIKREVLGQKGIGKLYDVLKHLNGLWSYGTTEWLRLTLPNPDDQTRSRWPVHPLWAALASVDWDTDGGPLSRNFSPERVPGNAKLFNLGFSNITSFMARQGIDDLYDGQEAFMAALYQFHSDKAYALGLPFDDYVAEKLAQKRREFNTRLNNPELEEERQAAEREKVARTYRKASDGE